MQAVLIKIGIPAVLPIQLSLADFCKMDAIQIWLNSSRDYLAGISLYASYGTNNFLKKLFQSGPDAYNKKKLVEELQKLAGKVAQMPNFVEESIKPPPTASLEEHAKYLSLLRKRDDIVRQIDRNMGLLDISNNKQVLHETAKQILRLHQTKTEIWAQIDFFDEHGCFELPAEKKEISRDKEIQLLYQAISKANKRLKNPDSPSRIKTEQLRNKHLKRLSELKEQL